MSLGVGFKMTKLRLIYITSWPTHLALRLGFISVPLAPPWLITNRFLLAFFENEKEDRREVRWPLSVWFCFRWPFLTEI